MKHSVSLALIKFLSDLAKQLGVSRSIYIVGGAVRNWVMDPTGEKYPIKDIDVVVDSLSLKGRDSEWFAHQVARNIPVQTKITTNQYGVALLHIVGDWMLGEANLRGEDIEIANARKESYTDGGYKPGVVEPATIEEDVHRREFTFNTLLWRLHDLAEGPDKAKILDLTGCGLRDLQEGVMRCPVSPDKTFSDDPSRMIRAVRFLIKYGFRISLEVERSIQKNKDKLKNIPHAHLSNMLIKTFLREPTGKKALLEMQRLGLLDVIREVARTEKPFREALANWADKEAKVEFLFDLMDLEMPVGKRLTFLSAGEQQRVRSHTVNMSHAEADFYLQVLTQPGKVIDTKSLMLEFNLEGAAARQVTLVARSILLGNPDLAKTPVNLMARVRMGLQSELRGIKNRRRGGLQSGVKQARSTQVEATTLMMFDFDGTLFRSQEAEPHWWSDPRPYSWGGNPVSLSPPCVPQRPGAAFWNSKAVGAAHAAMADPDVLVALITGRVRKFVPRLRALLKQQGIVPDLLYANPGISASTFKIQILGKLLKASPTITHVVIWENENLAAYKAAVEGMGAHLGRVITVTPHPVNMPPIPVDCNVEDLVDRVANRWLGASSCDAHHSMAWVDPRGKVHLIKSGTHAQWAYDYLGVQGNLLDVVPESLNKASWYHRTMLASRHLLDQGWIRVTNPVTFEVGDGSQISPVAWKAAVGLLIECVVAHGGRGRQWDPEMGKVWVDIDGLERTTPIADFVRQYGGRSLENRLFSELNEAVVQRIAKTYTINEGDPVLHGKFLNKPGRINGFGENEKGDPTVTIEPEKGGQGKEVKLFKIRYDEKREKQAIDWEAENRLFTQLNARVASKELARKGPKYHTSFYGNDDGSWEAVAGFVLGFRKAGYDWEMIPSMSSKNEWRTYSVEGATEHHQGFRKALKEIVHQYPEVAGFLISFDGPYKSVRDLVGVVAPSSPQIHWEGLTFFHGTSAKAWESIQKSGLQPRADTNVNPVYGAGSSAAEGRKDAIYLTTQITMAHFAALDAAKATRSDAVVLQIKGLEGRAMAADEDSGETDPVKSLSRLGSVAYVGNIHPSKVHLYEQAKGGGWEKIAVRISKNG